MISEEAPTLRRRDRRKPILVLDTQPRWVDTLRHHIGDTYRLEAPTGVRLDDLEGLAARDWRLVFMDAHSAVVDQRFHLEALQRWFARPNIQPVVVLSSYSSPIEAADALHQGAIYYADKPWSLDKMDRILTESLKLARRAKRDKRVGSPRYEFESTHIRTGFEPVLPD